MTLSLPRWGWGEAPRNGRVPGEYSDEPNQPAQGNRQRQPLQLSMRRKTTPGAHPSHMNNSRSRPHQKVPPGTPQERLEPFHPSHTPPSTKLITTHPHPSTSRANHSSTSRRHRRTKRDPLWLSAAVTTGNDEQKKHIPSTNGRDVRVPAVS